MEDERSLITFGNANVINKAAPVFLTEFHLGDGFKSLHKKLILNCLSFLVAIYSFVLSVFGQNL